MGRLERDNALEVRNWRDLLLKYGQDRLSVDRPDAIFQYQFAKMLKMDKFSKNKVVGKDFQNLISTD